MSQSQNDARLDDLASKVSALRGVTSDIYNQASDFSLLDANVGSASRREGHCERIRADY